MLPFAAYADCNPSCHSREAAGYKAEKTKSCETLADKF